MSKKILLTNDDGVYSAGIRAAYKSVDSLGDVTIAAPAFQKSGVGRSISIFEPLRMNRTKIDGVDAYAIGGTPTDSVILGIFSVMKEKPDLIVSGFNIGENISTDTATTSGTVGAALEGASYGIPAIAVSIQVIEQGLKFDDLRDYEHDFEVGIRVVNRIAKKVLEHGLPENVDILNVNLPHDVKEDTEIEITRLARKFFNMEVEERHDPRGRPYYWLAGDPIPEGEEGTDVHAVTQKGHISITPLSLDSTSRVDNSEIEKLF
ncbi:5'-nucleotidase /3'-nucleotidase /exopolyphosphatase [Methanohalophilus euhalobius]|jgi:5'-nucleotidase|uniref:5'-nucleotidase SurE n=1 Tax=Methanohalophilus euhalobius TaxID=51203 RepID=A0A285G6J8_9EURY|nr:MAG: 5'-nucleotidase [Methanohalophilus sp. 2-GBenrich]RXG33708.1 5'-nucleotidase [Methanohalophilus sp. WG1-DM]TCL11994.1 5'-nucleotidase /3'-nucleotidase /exopolyphosphatase [Methanohalophilus euhalobius]SNY18156.1 5'-nucleotidase /3'-nucleotidase /exopolyphosphatase [Methanohalophilus euhalobius]